jgi:CubicO group peptidase (beta-lactamase class C family)
MKPHLRSLARSLVLLVALGIAGADVRAQAPSDAVARIDRIFESFDSARSPGCAVGVARNGETVLERAWGMAELEHRVANAPGTIFEAGSVSKQFTAAAVVLLALEGTLSLDDDVRRWVPEVPDYGERITLRHMITHTSGLRDWGSVAGISGWGRSNRTHDHDHVLDIISRQSALNFPPGQQYSYSNSGYNLLAVVVERASGRSFADFSRERLFEPLGLHDTQWRDDYRRIVPGRSGAYSPAGDGFRINVPIEHVHGNGGLLTTVRDLLTWNEHLRRGTLGSELTAEMHTRGVLNDGQEIHYAGGLQFGVQNGFPRISHTGSTSGYRAYLALFPEQALSVALLCNVSSANPGALGGQVAAVFLPDPPATAVAGAGAPAGGPPGGQATQPERFAPSPDDLRSYPGVYHSDDAETTLEVGVDDGQLVVRRRPASRMALSPGTAPDTFGSPLGTIRFIRDDAGRVTELSVSQARVFDMRFQRVGR